MRIKTELHNKTTILKGENTMKKEKIITVWDLYKNLIKDTKVRFIESSTMEELTLEQAKDRKLGLIVPCGELQVNIFCD